MWSLGMILHKLLFFRLPYLYAADGDANGEPVGEVDDAEKLDRLEREVLSYTGFVCLRPLYRSHSNPYTPSNPTLESDSNQHRL